MGPSGHFYSCMSLRYETQVFRGLTSCQRTPEIWGVTGLLPTHRTLFVLCFRGISMMLFPKPCTILNGTGS